MDKLNDMKTILFITEGTSMRNRGAFFLSSEVIFERKIRKTRKILMGKSVFRTAKI